MRDKIGTTDRIGFVLNGKPVEMVDSSKQVFCKERQKPGGCPHHNLQCGYPQCDQPPIEKPN